MQPAADVNKTNEVVKCYSKKTSAYTPEKSNCIAEGGAGKPVCSPLPGEMGLGGYYGHYQGHWLSATSFLYNTTGNISVKAAADANIDVLADVMQAWGGKYPDQEGYLFPYDPLVWDKLLSGHGAGPYYSVPFYTLHKLMAGNYPLISYLKPRVFLVARPVLSHMDADISKHRRLARPAPFRRQHEGLRTSAEDGTVGTQAR
eukprot:SAG31_NODE_13301_length_878_cov_1.516046_1_plen_202_part_10